MIASKSITTTDKINTTHYGNRSTVSYSASMDIDSHQSHSLPRYGDHEHDAMDTSVDGGDQGDAQKVKYSDVQLNEPAPVPQDAQAVLERPRDEEARASMGNRQAYIPPKPDFSKDLLSLYNLHAIVASVARTDPVTGEKINRLRKSYEGKVKSLGLAGRNRAVKHEKDKMPGLAALADWPEDDWQVTKVMGRDVQKGLSSTTLAKLEKAMKMQPGPIPNNNEWEDLLGFEKAAPVQAVIEPAPKKRKEKDSVKANGLSNGAPRLKTGKASASASASASEAPRPKRAGKKRRYDEHSFEGYGEGFVDDEGGDTVMTGVGGGPGYSSGDGSRKSGPSKKRRKEYGSSAPSGVNDRNGSYGVGMMGMASGIGAYGR